MGGRRADAYEVTGELPDPRVPSNSANTYPSPTASRQSSSPASKCGFLFAATLEDEGSHRNAPNSAATKKVFPPDGNMVVSVFAPQIDESPRPRPQSRLWCSQTHAHLPRPRRRQRLCHANRLDRRRTVARGLCPRRRDLSEFRRGGLWPKKQVLALSVHRKGGFYNPVEPPDR